MAVTVNVRPAVVAIAPGATGTVTVDAQRMIEGPDDYTVTGTSYTAGITASPVSGAFAPDGSASRSLTIAVAQSAPHGYHPVDLTTVVGGTGRTFMLSVAVGQAGVDEWLTGLSVSP